MQKFILCVLTFAALCLSEWAYAQHPGGGRHHSGAPVVRGQAQPAPFPAPAVERHHDFGRAPERHHAPAHAHHHPVAAPPPQAPPPAPRPKSFLQICLPFLSFGLSK